MAARKPRTDETARECRRPNRRDPAAPLQPARPRRPRDGIPQRVWRRTPAHSPQSHCVHYQRPPFRREPDSGMTSVNDGFGGTDQDGALAKASRCDPRTLTRARDFAEKRPSFGRLDRLAVAGPGPRLRDLRGGHPPLGLAAGPASSAS
jgi:hypothetical protein